jgi:hypothetical protein
LQLAALHGALVRDMLAHCRRDQRGLVSAALREAFNAEDRAQARDRATQVISRLEPIAPKVCRLLEDAEEDLIAFYAFPREHWTKLRSTNPLERVNKETGRRSDVVGMSSPAFVDTVIHESGGSPMVLGAASLLRNATAFKTAIKRHRESFLHLIPGRALHHGSPSSRICWCVRR